ncbi:hypothetical protein [Paenibacillus sp. GP183]|uniref:hypothetical protein n=1 Tax=Paenibacillus sp. GP183 TaxID=1882751 RepID=UPI0008944CB0|nr:hypothetical protein [Paenibacillus sp. GP183]SEB67415.1 hypothetical protein SAMN05443246_1535 [Paenibacillus sp. GP183]
MDLKFGQIFDENDLVSRWVIQFYSICNDILYTNSKVLHHLDKEGHSALTQYYFRLASSHLKEAIDFFGHSLQFEEIKTFITRFNPDDQEIFNQFINCINGILYNNLNSFRNNSFHYPKIDNKDLIQSIRKNKNNKFELFDRIDGSERALFSDLISMSSTYKYLGDGKNLSRSLRNLSKAVALLLKLKNKVMQYYIQMKKPDIEIIYKNRDV